MPSAIEGLEGIEQLKIWKGAYLEGEAVCGNVAYRIAERRGYLEAPFACIFACIIEAKKDDFEQGTAQCLVEMQACQWVNQQLGKTQPIYGIVTNGEGWKFYRLTVGGDVFESWLYGIGNYAYLARHSPSFLPTVRSNHGDVAHSATQTRVQQPKGRQPEGRQNAMMA